MVADNNPKAEPKKDERPSGGPPPPVKRVEHDKEDKRTSRERAQALADSPNVTAIAEGDPLDPFWSEKTEEIKNVDESLIDTGEGAGTMAIQNTTPVTWSSSQVAHDWLKWEEDSRFSRDTVRLASGPARTIVSGTILGKQSAGGTYIELDPAGAGGAEVAVAILVMTTQCPAGVQVDVAAVVRDALVVRSLLIFAVGTPTQPQKDAAMVQLEAKGIIPRQGA